MGDEDEVPEDEVQTPVNEELRAKAAEMENLLPIENLSLEGVLEMLRERFAQHKIYTLAGPVLIAVNPFERFEKLYGPRVMKSYFNATVEDVSAKGGLGPSIFLTAEMAYRGMLLEKTPQAVVISGESGAGKTEATKQVMHYVFSRSADAADKSGEALAKRILATNPVLEAFGNAKTVRNNNSSRFGKFIQLEFDHRGRPIGSKIKHFLLEKVRVMQQNEGERNYHCFYQLLAGARASKRRKYHLKDVSYYRCLNGSGCTSVDGLDDGEEFRLTNDGLEKIGMSEAEIDDVWKIVAGVLSLGNVEFEEDGEGSKFSSESRSGDAKNAAELFGVEMKGLEQALTTTAIQGGGRGSVALRQNKPEVAESMRDAMAKHVYHSLFAYIVERMNKTLASGAPEYVTPSIGILDIYGFEIFESNSLEQLCINFTNEMLQCSYIQSVFLEEQNEYKEEGLMWTDVDYTDNQGTVDLIGKAPSGVMPMLDDYSTMPRTSDENWARQMSETHASNPLYTADRFNANQFSLKHFAGTVPYNATGFLDKNRDTLDPGVPALMMKSTCELMADVIRAMEVAKGNVLAATAGGADGSEAAGMAPPSAAAAGPKGGGGGGGGGRNAKKKATISFRFRQELTSLMAMLNERQRWYVRCVKPNKRLRRRLFVDDMVSEQLVCQAVVETIEVRRAGYTNRYKQESFATRFWVILGKPGLHLAKSDPHKCCEQVLVKSGITAPDKWKGSGVPPWQLGLTKVFIKETSTLIKLEAMRDAAMVEQVVQIQAWYRAVKGRERFLEQRAAVIRCQAIWKGAVQRYRFRCHRAAIPCQAIRKGTVQRRRYIRFLTMSGPAATLIQSVRRMLRARSAFRLVKRAAITCQGRRRALLARREFAKAAAAIEALLGRAGPVARVQAAFALRRELGLVDAGAGAHREWAKILAPAGGFATNNASSSDDAAAAHAHGNGKHAGAARNGGGATADRRQSSRMPMMMSMGSLAEDESESLMAKLRGANGSSSSSNNNNNSKAAVPARNADRRQSSRMPLMMAVDSAEDDSESLMAKLRACT
mmetsp:Transcript_1925/g.7056  ORF Transcript_1925/g.7056 Transcript_1925/m.7056 type:complete len:1050 (-) Transcript_1925:113-3262(-)